MNINQSNKAIKSAKESLKLYKGLAQENHEKHGRDVSFALDCLAECFRSAKKYQCAVEYRRERVSGVPWTKIVLFGVDCSLLYLAIIARIAKTSV
jgi:enolase